MNGITGQGHTKVKNGGTAAPGVGVAMSAEN